MRRYLLLTLLTMAVALAVASSASADRVFGVDGAKAPGPPRYVLHWGSERGPLLVAEDGTETQVEIDTPLSLGDCTKLRAHTGWTPRYSFDETLDVLLDSWRAAIAAGDHR